MRIFTMLLMAALLATTFATAQDCTPTTSRPEVDVAGTFYVDDDGSLCEPCAISIWVYQESNGFPGLQRNDDVKDDTCGGQIASDTIIF